jgi:hypothetical protein
MSVKRQTNLLGSQRVDLPAIRAIESSVCNDFDVLAGTMLGGRRPLVVKGFKIVSTGAATADQLQLEVAGASVVHFMASESGSIFTIDDDQDAETLNSTNARLIGSFSPGSTNYVGVDFVRTVDETTADLSMFRDANQEQEIPKVVPQARIIEYRIFISTKDFSSLPGVCPIGIVRTDTGNEIIEIKDARNKFFGLGSGGTAPNSNYAYPWPAGRKEITSGDVFAGGDKEINDLKTWADAIATRVWELGGGEKWYSPTADRNLRFLHTGAPFITTGEYFEWDGTDLHWKGLRVSFENSTASFNAIADQTGNEAGLTNLADGECIYVDLDRTENRTGPTALVAKKAPLTVLGTGTPPGSRIVFAWRFGSQVFTRDQGYAVGSSFKVATIAANGTVRLSASADPDPSEPVVAVLQAASYYQVIAGGLSRGNAIVNDFIDGAGPLIIGGGTADRDISLLTTQSPDAVTVSGIQDYSADGRATLEVVNEAADLDGDNLLLRLRAYNDQTATTETGLIVDAYGAVGYRATPNDDIYDPSTAVFDPEIVAKEFYRTNGQTPGQSPPVCRLQKCVVYVDGTIDVLWEGPLH